MKKPTDKIMYSYGPCTVAMCHTIGASDAAFDWARAIDVYRWCPHYGTAQDMCYASPASLDDAMAVMQHGAEKYAPHDYRTAFYEPWFRDVYVSALLRHFCAWAGRDEIDPDSGLPHAAHALACAMILLDLELHHAR